MMINDNILCNFTTGRIGTRPDVPLTFNFRFSQKRLKCFNEYNFQTMDLI